MMETAELKIKRKIPHSKQDLQKDVKNTKDTKKMSKRR